jgi:hypothetical protein
MTINMRPRGRPSGASPRSNSGLANGCTLFGRLTRTVSSIGWVTSDAGVVEFPGCCAVRTKLTPAAHMSTENNDLRRIESPASLVGIAFNAKCTSYAKRYSLGQNNRTTGVQVSCQAHSAKVKLVFKVADFSGTSRHWPTEARLAAVPGSNYLYGASPYFNARGCSDSTPLNVLTGNRQPVCL